MEYTLTKLEPGGKYHIIVQLGNMSKESSIKITTGKWEGEQGPSHTGRGPWGCSDT